MPLLEHFEISGKWLFRRRGFLPLLLFLILYSGLRGFHYFNGSHFDETLFELACFVLGLSGQAIRVHAIGHVAPRTSGNGRRIQAQSLNITGLYSVVRHPLYLGSYLMWLSAALLSRNLWVVIVITLAFWLYYERIMFAEESFLRREFGTSYDRWAHHTPAFLPDVRLWKPPAEPFHWRDVLLRERSAFAALALTFAVFDAYVDASARGGLPELLWLSLVAVAASIYLVTELDKQLRDR
jgi:protein-S-isoprenylcysteine O-methyltransferase Ste14